MPTTTKWCTVVVCLALAGCPPLPPPAGAPNPPSDPAPEEPPSDAPVPEACAPPVVDDEVAMYACTYPRLHAAGRMAVDAFQPLGVEGAPVVMYIHGGGFISGNRGAGHGVCRHLARERGITCATIEYQLRPSRSILGIRVPAERVDELADMDFMYDGASAFAWLRRNAGHFGGDSDRLVVMGHSAGGILAAILAADPAWIRWAMAASGEPDPGDDFRITDFIRGVVDVSGPVDLDLSRRWYTRDKREAIARGLSEQMRSHVSLTEVLARTGTSPPLLLVAGGGRHGLASDLPDLGDAMADVARQAHALGVPATYIQLVLHRRRAFGAPFERFSGRACFWHPGHVQTNVLLAGGAQIVLPQQDLWNEVSGVCAHHLATSTGARHAGLDSAIAAFVRDPSAPIPWDAPGFSPTSVPDRADASPLHINLGGGELPANGGPAWTAGHHAATTRNPSRTEFEERANDPIYATRLVPQDPHSLSLEVELAPTPGVYTARLHFSEPRGSNPLTLAVGDAPPVVFDPWTEEAGRASWVEVPNVRVDDGLSLRVTSVQGGRPHISGLELRR